MRFLRNRAAIGALPHSPWTFWRRLWRRGPVRHTAKAIAVLLVAGTTAWSAHAGILGRWIDAGGKAALDASARLGLAAAIIEIEGRSKTPREDVVMAIGIKGKPALLAIDLEAMRQRIETLPWVQAAVVERRYPDRLLVRLTEYEPFALWQHQGRFHLIASDGRVIEATGIEQYRHLPIVVGLGAPARAAEILAMIDAIPGLKRHVRAAVLVGERRWNVRLDRGIDVKLPEAAPEAAWALLEELVRDQDILAKDISIIDLRFEGRVVLRLAHPPGAGAPASEAEGGKET